MQTDPYSIYTDQRPLKVAFLIDRSEGSVWIDRIVAFNREKWGGRYNPILLTDGKEISDDQWAFLRVYDPDLIKAFVPLSEDLQRRIHVFLSPLSVESFKADDDRVYVRDDPISLLPDQRLISQLAHDFPSQATPLLLFDLADDTPPVIRDFITRNFGVLDPEDQVYYIKDALKEARTSVYKISDVLSLNNFLAALGDYRRAVFPSQFCALPNHLDDVQFDRSGHRFALIVGDSPEDLAYAWNRPLTIPKWLRTQLTQLWLPNSLAGDSAIRPGLTKFLNRFIDATGNQGQRGAHIVSRSLSDEELQDVANFLRTGLHFFAESEVLPTQPTPRFETRPPFSVRRGRELHRSHSSEEYLVVDEPGVQDGAMGGQAWMVDIAVQYRPERFASFVGKEFWWRLPARNSVLYDTHFFSRLARVQADHGFTVMMSRRSVLYSDNSTLIVKLPEDQSVAYSLICGESFEYFKQDDKGRQSRPFHSIAPSDKGRYLSGVLSLFPDLLAAHSVFAERYWRTTFALMANQSKGKDERRKDAIVNTIKKHAPDWQQFDQDQERLEWWAERILSIAKDYSKEDKELDYRTLLNDAIQETEAYNVLHPERPAFEVDENDLKESIDRLLSWNVLLQGIRPKCPRCGYRIWYHVDKATQNMLCDGCGYDFTVPAEEPWYYRLNTLVRAAVSTHGTVPLLLVLGQLLLEARTSFMFSPCLDLFRHRDDGSREYEQVGELDLVCVVDGRFTIGEVKNSIGLFTTKDFDAVERIAKAIKPDVILFSALEGRVSAFVTNSIARLQKELASLEVEVKWYPLRESVSEPHPVR